MRSLLEIFGWRPQRSAVAQGALVSVACTLTIGVFGGSLVAERTGPAYAVNGLLFMGLMAGGALAASRARDHQLLAAVGTSLPVMVIAVVVQAIRLFGPGEATSPLGLLLAMLLSVSLATLGGVLARLRRARRPSLTNSAAPSRTRTD